MRAHLRKGVAKTCSKSAHFCALLLKMCALLSILFNFCSFLSNFSQQLAQMVRKPARLCANFNAFANKLAQMIRKHPPEVRYTISLITQLNTWSCLGIICFSRYENKKSQILTTTESGFGGGWWKANGIIALYLFNRKVAQISLIKFPQKPTLFRRRIKFFVPKILIFLLFFEKPANLTQKPN